MNELAGDRGRPSRSPASFVCCHHPILAQNTLEAGEPNASKGFSCSPLQTRGGTWRALRQGCPISNFSQLHLRWISQLSPAGGSVSLWKRPLGASLQPGAPAWPRRGPQYLRPKRMEDNVRNLHFRACSFRSSDSYLEICGPCLPEGWDSELKIAPLLPSLLYLKILELLSSLF